MKNKKTLTVNQLIKPKTKLTFYINKHTMAT